MSSDHSHFLKPYVSTSEMDGEEAKALRSEMNEAILAHFSDVEIDDLPSSRVSRTHGFVPIRQQDIGPATGFSRNYVALVEGGRAVPSEKFQACLRLMHLAVMDNPGKAADQIKQSMTHLSE